MYADVAVGRILFHAFKYRFYSIAKSQSNATAVLAMANLSVCPSIRHLCAGTVPRRMKIISCRLHCEVAQTL